MYLRFNFIVNKVKYNSTILLDYLKFFCTTLIALILIFNGKDMYSTDSFAPVGRFEPLKSIPEDKETDTPIDFPIVVQYPNKIDLVNENNISLSDGKNYYGVKAFISGNMLTLLTASPWILQQIK